MYLTFNVSIFESHIKIAKGTAGLWTLNDGYYVTLSCSSNETIQFDFCTWNTGDRQSSSLSPLSLSCLVFQNTLTDQIV